MKPSNVALHEAAHAVAAHLAGARVEELCITGEETGYCMVRYELPGSLRSSCPIIRAFIHMAGHEAEVAYRGRDRRKLPSSDFKPLLRRFSMIGLNTLRPQVVFFVKGWKRHIFAVARRLEQRRTLSRRMFLKAFREAD